MTGPAETFVLAGDAFRLHYIGPQPEVPTSIGLTMSGIQPLPERLPESSLLVVPGVSDSRIWFDTGAGGAGSAHWLMRLQPQIHNQEHYPDVRLFRRGAGGESGPAEWRAVHHAP